MRVIRLICVGMLLPIPGWADDTNPAAAMPAQPYTLPAADDALPALDCLINPSKVVNVSSAVPGVVARVKVERADSVQKGQLLAELDADVEQATLALAEARAAMIAESEGEKVNLAFDELQQTRLRTLSSQNLVSERDRDEALRSLQLSQWRLRQTEELHRVRKQEYALALAQLDQKRIQSPIDGRVVQIFKHEGEYVDEQPILQVVQLDPLRVEAIMPMHLYGRVSPGMLAQVYPEVSPEQAHEARVTLVDPVGDAASGTFGVRLELDNPEGRLPAGMKCTLSFTGVSIASGTEFAPQMAAQTPGTAPGTSP